MTEPYFTAPGVTLWHANALDLPLPDASVDLIVTSPPYFGLRSYQDGGEHYSGQIGSEATPAEFLDALIAATREMVRVLKPSGSIWVNLGDKYAAGHGGSSTEGNGVNITVRRTRQAAKHWAGESAHPSKSTSAIVPGFRPKSLMGMPWRYAIRCIDELGLILRAEVIWSKPNGLPESVTDRVRRSHEQWFCFQQSGGVEATTEGFPFCPLCGRPVDARATLVRRLKECNGGVESVRMANEVRPDVRSQQEDARSSHGDVTVGTLVPSVPSLNERDTGTTQDAPDFVEDGVAAVVDRDAQYRPALTAHEGHSSLAVDDPSEPAGVCECEGHALTIDDEPWIPQRLAAEIMQRVAEGEIDPQQAADFLSGDYVRNHSVWFHFTVQPRYFSAVDEIREATTDYRASRPLSLSERGNVLVPGNTPRGMDGLRNTALAPNPLGKLPGSVWTVPTQPLTVPAELGIDHFAAFPMEWPRRIIKGWAPTAGVCVECGEGRRPVVASVGLNLDRPQARRAQELADRAGLTEAHFDALLAVGVSDTGRGRATQSGTGKNRPEVYALADEARAVLGGYAREYLLRRPTGLRYACACPEPTAPTTPAVVLDPFGGTGTTALVASVLGCHGHSVDMSADYCRLAQWRVTDPGQRAAAAQVEAVEPVSDEQPDLFGGVA